MMASLLPAAFNAQAQSSSSGTSSTGTYNWQITDPSTGDILAISPSFTGGKWYSAYGQSPGPYDYESRSGSTGGSTETGDSSGQTDSEGKLTASFLWSDSNNPNDPAPPCVIAQTSIAQYYGQPPFTAPPSCNDGLGDSKSGGSSAYCSKTVYSVNLPSGVEVDLSLSGAQASLSPVTIGDFYSTVYWEADDYPVVLTLSGQNSADQALTGQQIMASLSMPNGLPSGTKITSYTWSFTGGTKGNPIKGWDGTNNTVQLTPWLPTDFSQTDTSGNGLSGVNSLSFYDEIDQDAVTVKCAINLAFPDGTTGTVNAQSAPVTFIKLTVAWTVSKSFDNLTPGFLPNQGQAFGANELWGPMVITEPPALVPNGPGTGCIVQVANPFGRSFAGTDQNGNTITYAQIQYVKGDGTTGKSSSPTGLDGGFPYPFGYIANANGTFTSVNSAYTWKANIKGYAADGPLQTFTPTNSGTMITWFSSTANDSFNTWVMYCPPANGLGTIYVPLQTLTWSWGGNASLTGKVWSVSEGPSFTPGLPGDATTPPAWSLKIPVGLVIGP